MADDGRALQFKRRGHRETENVLRVERIAPNVQLAPLSERFGLGEAALLYSGNWDESSLLVQRQPNPGAREIGVVLRDVLCRLDSAKPQHTSKFGN